MTELSPQSSNSKSPETFTIPSILSIACAAGSFFVGAIGGIILAVLAIIFGAIGTLLAVSPKRRGGCLSTASIIMGAIGVIAAIAKGVMYFGGN